MSTNGTPNATSHDATSHDAGNGAVAVPEQLSLLSTPSVPLQFRLDERTRRCGLQHVAELRALMVAQAAGRRTGSGRNAALSRRPATDRQIAA